MSWNMFCADGDIILLVGDMGHSLLSPLNPVFVISLFLCVYMFMHIDMCVCGEGEGFICIVCGDQRATLGVILRDRFL